MTVDDEALASALREAVARACEVVPEQVDLATPLDELGLDSLAAAEVVTDLERMLVRSGIRLIKLWFSVSRSEQRTRFVIRQVDPVRQWKLSPNDLASLDKWDDYTEAKEAMFFYTDTAEAPWTVVKSNDKKRARLEAMRHVLSLFPYEDKDAEIVGMPDPLVVGPAATLLEQGEGVGYRFPKL